MAHIPKGPAVLDRRAIAAMFGFGPQWWTRLKGTYINDRNFPPPLPGNPRFPRWSKAQVDRWFETGGKTYKPDDERVEKDAGFEARLERYVEGRT